jgi:hypothetical protein
LRKAVSQPTGNSSLDSLVPAIQYCMRRNV